MAAPQPFDQGDLTVSENPRHTIHYEQYGRKDGIPVIFLHGGPGVGADTDDLRFFNLKDYRVILLDQRCAPKSTFEPGRRLEGVTTQAMVEDIHKLRANIGLKDQKVHLFGGSWGATLGLAYAIAHPSSVKSLILWGAFLGRQQDIDYTDQMPNPGSKEDHASLHFPNEWKHYADYIPEAERHDLVKAYDRRVHDPDPAVWHEAVRRVARWSTVVCGRNEAATANDIKKMEAEWNNEDWLNESRDAAKLDYHFYRNLYFLPPNHIIGNADKLRNIPIRLYAGTHDFTCGTRGSRELHAALQATKRDPNCVLDYRTVDAGHGTFEPAMENVLKAAMIDIARREKLKQGDRTAALAS